MKVMYFKTLLLLFAALCLPVIATAAEKPAAPYVNPHLAGSIYPVTHAATDVTPLLGPIGPSHRLSVDELQWKPVGPINGFPQIYSAPYPNGKRVIWVGGYDRVAKLDADTLEVLTTYAIGGNTYYGDEETKRYLEEIDQPGDQALARHVRFWSDGPFRSAVSIYRLLSRENEFYLPYRAPDGSLSLRVYGEADAADPASKILLRREWHMPPEVSASSIFGMQMTSDGHIVMTTQDGVMIALSQNFTSYSVLRLPNRNGVGETRDVLSSFVRNSMSVDERGGVYVVTRDNLHRVQWTGKALSLDEADGAWSVPYPNGLGIGSGTTPALMGWGPKEDHLVVIADSNQANDMLAVWRDEIPSDWKGLPGFDRRVAAITLIHFGVSKNEQTKIENALVVYGYGAFINNTYPEHPAPNQGSPTKQWLVDSFSLHLPGHESRGGTMIEWDTKARVLKTVWQSQANFVSAICMISAANETLYCWGARNGEWTLEGVDWKTGKSDFHYILGKSQRFNPFGGFVIVNPDGIVDCACPGGLGIVRIRPQPHLADKKQLSARRSK